MNVFRRMWDQQRWLSLLFAMTLVITLTIVFRVAVHASYWWSQQQPSVRPWMTIGYVAHTYSVPKNPLFEAFRIKYDLKRGDPETISHIAARLEKPEQEVVLAIRLKAMSMQGATR